MFSRRLFISLMLGLGIISQGFGQDAEKNIIPPTIEFPLSLDQSVQAGKTPIGTKITGKLTMATLVNGIVIPRNTSFSGQVTVSQAKSHTEPSRLMVRIDSVSSKNGTAAVTLYLTPHYYPTVLEGGQDLQYGPSEPASSTWNGAGEYPDPKSHSYKPFPAGDSDAHKDKSVPDTPVSSKHSLNMSHIEAEQGPDGNVVLVSRHANIKLERLTTYVFTAPDQHKTN